MDALQNQALDRHEAGGSSVSPSLAEDRWEIELRERKLAIVTDRVLIHGSIGRELQFMHVGVVSSFYP
jgi:hypothetical protein